MKKTMKKEGNEREREREKEEGFEMYNSTQLGVKINAVWPH